MRKCNGLNPLLIQVQPPADVTDFVKSEFRSCEIENPDAITPRRN